MKYLAILFVAFSLNVTAEEVRIINGLPFMQDGVTPALELQVIFEKAMQEKYGEDFRRTISMGTIFKEMLELERLASSNAMRHLYLAKQEKEYAGDYNIFAGGVAAGTIFGLLLHWWISSHYDEEYPTTSKNSDEKFPHLIEQGDVTLAVLPTSIYVFKGHRPLVVINYEGKGTFLEVRLSKDNEYIFARVDGGYRAWQMDGKLAVALDDLEINERKAFLLDDAVLLSGPHTGSQLFDATTGEVFLDVRVPNGATLTSIYRNQNGKLWGKDELGQGHLFDGYTGRCLSTVPNLALEKGKLSLLALKQWSDFHGIALKNAVSVLRKIPR